MKRKTLISIPLVLAIIISLFGGFSVQAAATDVASYLNTDKSYSPTSMGVKPSSNNISSHSSATLNKTGSLPSNKLGNDTSVNTEHTITGNAANSVSRIGLRSLAVGTKYDGNTAKILHVGWTMTNESGIDIDLTYQVFTNEERALATWSDGILSYDDYSVAMDPSYHADWFVDCQTSTWRLYLNNILFAEDSLPGNTTQLRNLYFKAKTAGSYSYTITDAVYMTYKAGITMEDVVAYTLTKDTSRNYYWPTNCRNDGYYWSVNGIGDIGGTGGKRIVGNTTKRNSGSGDVSGSNYIITASDSEEWSGVGYRLRMLIANGTYTTRGCLPQDAENDNIIHQSLTITPNLTDGNSAAIGFRGNNAYQTEKYIFDEENGYVSGQPYQFDILVNNKDKQYWVLVDGIERATGYTGNSYLAEFVYTIANAGSDTLVLSNIVTKSYDYTISMDDVLASVRDLDTEWTQIGFSGNSDTIGYLGGLCSYTGDNVSGYTISPDSINETNKGFARYYLGTSSTSGISQSANNSVLWQSFYYKPAVVTQKQEIGIRGGTGSGGYLWFLAVNASTNAIEDSSGNKIATLDTSKFYRIDFVMNNKDYKYYWLLDGVCFDSGYLYSARRPIWQVTYRGYDVADNFVFRDLHTHLYASTADTQDVVTRVLEKLYAEIDSVSVSGSNMTVNALYTGPTTDAGSNTKAMYAIYDASGSLKRFFISDGAQSLINAGTHSPVIEMPDDVQTSDVLTIKAFMWNLNVSSNIMQAISNWTQKTYTIQ